MTFFKGLRFLSFGLGLRLSVGSLYGVSRLAFEHLPRALTIPAVTEEMVVAAVVVVSRSHTPDNKSTLKLEPAMSWRMVYRVCLFAFESECRENQTLNPKQKPLWAAFEFPSQHSLNLQY